MQEIAGYVAPAVVFLGALWKLMDGLWKRIEQKIDSNHATEEAARIAIAKALEYKLQSETSTLKKMHDDRHTETMGEMALIKEQTTKTNGSVTRIDHDLIELRLDQARLEGAVGLGKRGKEAET